MRLAHPFQLSEKIGILRQALERIGGFRELPSEIRIVSAGSDVGYRTRIRLHVHDGALGFYARGTHRLVEIPRCVVAADDVNRSLEKLRAVAARRPGSLAPFREVEIRAAPSQPTSVRFVPRAGADASTDAVSALFSELGRDTLVSIASHGVDPEQRFELPDGVELTVPASAFVQVNQAVNRSLVEAVVAGAQSRNVASFCDVFCGAGNFTLPLAAADLDGVGIDRASSGIAAAERSARASKLSVELVQADARTTLERFVRERRLFDLVLLDPPRIGAKQLILQVTSLGARYVAMVSCDPPTFARDLRALREGGFALEELVAFDMFPHTPHVEALAWMARSGGD
jgi:23S rRNA (uracil1939-C5)-methyltransferase